MSWRIRALIVDDNPADADLIGERLSMCLHIETHVTTAMMLDDALARLAYEHFDLVILDLNLPDSSGADTLRRLCDVTREPAYIVVSGVVDEPLRASLLALGADEVIAKEDIQNPLSVYGLLYVIERARAHRERVELLEATPDATIVTNADGIVQHCNGCALELLGIQPADLASRQVVFAVRPDAEVEVEIPRANSSRFGALRVVRSAWRGKPAYLASIRDITKQKNLEMQLLMSDRLISLGTLAAGIAHEINNPLAAILGNVDFSISRVATTADDEQSRDLLDALIDAKDATERVRDIVRDVRVFARNDEKVRTKVDVHRLIDSVARMAWNEIKHRARLVKDLQPLACVDANESQLSQVFLNLLVNAAQAIPEGAASRNEIRISTRMEARQVVIDIRDTGIGISPNALSKVFMPFFTTKGDGAGTGLGLSISQRIVASFGGTIMASSRVGVGSCFSVRLPASDGAAVPEFRVERPVEPATRRGRVLVVDDEVAVAKTIERMLEREHDVHYFSRVEDAFVELQRGARYDLILCDVMMPELTGMDMFEKLQRLGGGLDRRVVFLTGGAFSAQAREFLERVSDRALEKPFDRHTLRTLVNRAVNGGDVSQA